MLYGNIYLQQMNINFMDAVLMCTISAGIGALVHLAYENFLDTNNTLGKYDTVFSTCSIGCITPPCDRGCIGTCGAGYSCGCSWCTHRVPESLLAQFPYTSLTECAAVGFAHIDCPICTWHHTRCARTT